MILELDPTASPEERGKAVKQHLDIYGEIKSVSRDGFTIVQKGYEPNFGRRDMARIINLRVKLGDTMLGFQDIKSGIKTEQDRGYDGEWVDSQSSVLTIKFAPTT